MASGIGRNNPCWCGSGKKYKVCHLNREIQSPIPLNEEFERFRQAFKERKCFHPKSPAECNGRPVQAHTVQRASLAKIAVDSHVYGINPDIAKFHQKGGRLEVRKIGLNDASTFTGFCSRHDSELFRPIEGGIVSPCRHHALLLAYRAICREISTMHGQIAVGNVVRDFDRGRPSIIQANLQSMVLSREKKLRASLTHLDQNRLDCENLFRSLDSPEIRFWAAELETPPDVMLSGVCTPEFDFQGKDLRDKSTPPAILTVSLLSSGEKGLAMLAWIGDQLAPRQFAASLDAINFNEIPHALIRLAFEHFENLYWSPRWWTSLGAGDKIHILGQLQPSRHAIPRTPECLKDDGVRLVDWRVTRRTHSWD